MKQRKAYIILIFLISPIAGFIHGIYSKDYRFKLFIFTLFGFFFGTLLNLQDGYDGAKHLKNVKLYSTFSSDEIISRSYQIITLNPVEESPVDLYVHVLYIISGYIFDSGYLLFSLSGAIYGYFYGRAILKVTQRWWSISHTFIITALMILFVIHRSFDSMQTVRSWTGMWVLFNGIFSYSETKKTKYLVLIFIAPLMHLMYSFISIPALFFFVTNKFIPRAVYILLLVSSFLLNINSITVQNTVSQNSISQSRFSMYYNVDSEGNGVDPIAKRNEKNEGSIISNYGKTTAVYFGAIYLLFFLILFGYYNIKKMSNVEYSLVTIGLLMVTLANYLSFAYAFYSRIMANATTYILATVVLISLRPTNNFDKINSIQKNLLIIGILIFLPKVIYFVLSFLKFISIFLLVFPYPIFFNHEFNSSIRDLFSFND